MTKNSQKWSKNKVFGLLRKIKSSGLSGIGVKRKFLWSTDIGPFWEKTKQGELRTYFFENPLEFIFFSLLLEIPDKTKLHPWKFHKIVFDPLETPRAKTKTLKTPHYFFLVTSPPVPPFPPCFFFWNSPFCENYMPGKNLFRKLYDFNFWNVDKH